jgi:hypothetical protein
MPSKRSYEGGGDCQPASELLLRIEDLSVLPGPIPSLGVRNLGVRRQRPTHIQSRSERVVLPLLDERIRTNVGHFAAGEPLAGMVILWLLKAEARGQG